MKKDVQAKIVTGLLIAGVIGFVVAKRTGWEPSSGSGSSLISRKSKKPVEPRDTIYAMLDAARDGDVEAYVGCFTGEAERRIAQSRDEMTAERFATYLAERNREIKGIAINQAEPAGEGRTHIRVEYVYEDRNEAQRFLLTEANGEWRIAGMEQAERVETLVPYGTPVY